MYGLTLITAPARTPVDLDAVRRHVRVVDQFEDDLLQQYLEAATEVAQARTCRQLITATWRLTLDRFWRRRLRLPKGRLQEIDSITYIDTAGVEQTLDDELYHTEAGYEPAIVEPAYSASWPATRCQSGAVKITFTCGYGDVPEQVDPQIRQGILLCINDWWESPGNAIIGENVSQLPVPTRATSLFRGGSVADWFEEYGPPES